MGPVDFIPWAVSVIHSFETQQLLVYLITGIIGMFAHYVKQYLTDNVSGNFFKYMIGDHPKQSLLTVGSFLISGVGYVYSGAATGITWPALIGLAATTGYTFDSTMNKATPKEFKNQV